MLNVTDLTKQYGDFTAVEDVGFTAQEGTIFGLLGPNGAGKSTTINCISGLMPPTAGHISIAGFDIVKDAHLISAKEKEVELLKGKSTDASKTANREHEAMARDILRGHEKAEEWKQEVEDARTEVTRFEEVNAELLLENEELKEKLDAMSYLLDQEHSRRGQLVRAELRAMDARRRRGQRTSRAAPRRT